MTASTSIPYGAPIRWGGSDLFTHMLIIGPTRCGKTSTLLKPMMYQMLKARKMGIPLGLSLVEPKGDVAMLVREMCEVMDIDMTHIDPTRADTKKFNPFEGEEDDVAEATVVVLKGLFGKQDAFFATVQELSARSVTKMLKRLHGDDMDITDVVGTLRDEELMEAQVDELIERDGMDDLTSFMKTELLGTMREKYRQFVIGLRAQLENLASNKALQKVMVGKSSISIDEHFETGGILSVNTALGMLRSSGDAFGQFVIMHLQNGTFRRKGTEKTRVPHFMIIDEYSRYINPDVEIFLSLAAEYRVAGIFATQSLGQLEIEAGKIGAKAMKRAILASCRNKICFGGVTYEDAQDFADVFGKDRIIMRQNTYKNNLVLPTPWADSYRDTEVEEYRFSATDLQDGIPRFNFVHQLMTDGVVQKPSIGRGEFVAEDWKEKREWETDFNKAVASNTERDKEDQREIFGMVRKFWHGFTQNFGKGGGDENESASESMTPLQEARLKRGQDITQMAEQAKFEEKVETIENSRPPVQNDSNSNQGEGFGYNLTSLTGAGMESMESNENEYVNEREHVPTYEEEQQPVEPVESQVTANHSKVLTPTNEEGFTRKQIAEIISKESTLGETVARAMKDAFLQLNANKQAKQQEALEREQAYIQQQQEEADQHLQQVNIPVETDYEEHGGSGCEENGDVDDTIANAQTTPFNFDVSVGDNPPPAITTASDGDDGDGEVVGFKKKSRKIKNANNEQDAESLVKAPIVEGLDKNPAEKGNVQNTPKHKNRSFVKNDSEHTENQETNKQVKNIRGDSKKPRKDDFW